MGMREDFADYTDPNGLLQPDIHPPAYTGSGNGIRYFSEMMITYSKLGVVTDADRAEFVRVIRSLEARPGLLNRNPPTGPHPDQQGLDDYAAMTAAAKILGGPCQQLAVEVLNYGSTRRMGLQWVYNNVLPDSPLKHPDGRVNTSSFFFRFPALIAHFHWCAGRTPSLFYRTAWAATVASSGMNDRRSPTNPRPDQDARALTWLLIQAYPKGQYGACDQAARAWWKRFKEDFPGGINQVLQEYFNNPSHPLVKYAVTDWPLNI